MSPDLIVTIIVASVASLPALISSIATSRKQAKCEREMKKYERRFEMIRSRILHYKRHLRMLDRLVGMAMPPGLMERALKDLEDLADKLDTEVDELTDEW